MSLLRQIFGPSKEEMWRELSSRIGAEFVDGGFWKGSKVVASSGPWTVTLDTYTVSTGKSSVTYTRLRAPYVNRDGFRFHLYRAGIFSQLGKFLGMQDIPIGDVEFDRQFIVKSNHPDQARKLLANGELRALLLRQPAVSFSVVDDEGWFGQHFPEGVDELHFQVVGVIKDVDRLKLLFDLFAETLDTLCVIGSAYETPPFEKVDIPDADKLLRSSDSSDGDELLRPALASSQTDPNLLPRPADAPAERA
jgi:hypothetical protein